MRVEHGGFLMSLRKIDELDLNARRVFLRADLDVPLTPAGGIADPVRIDLALPTIRHALEQGARLVIASRLGRSTTVGSQPPSLEPVGAYLAERLGRDVLLADEPAGDGTRKVVSDLREGELALLENLRLAPGDESNEETLSQALASYGDVYVNDAFASVSRAYASTVGMVRSFADRAIGLLFARELEGLARLTGDVARPYYAVLGGSGLATRVALIDRLIDRVDGLYLGGALANTFIRARGGQVGRSRVEEDKLVTARVLLKKASDRDVPIHLPRDLIVAAGTHAGSGKGVPAGAVPENLAALDIGPETAASYGEAMRGARTIVWNGPMGAYEAATFATGTFEIAAALARAVGAFTLVVGDDTCSAVAQAGAADRISHISRGGDAALAFLSGKELPGLQALQN